MAVTLAWASCPAGGNSELPQFQEKLEAGELAQVSGHPSLPSCGIVALDSVPERSVTTGPLSPVLTHRALQGAELSRCVAVREPPAGLPWPPAGPFSPFPRPPPMPEHTGPGSLGPCRMNGPGGTGSQNKRLFLFLGCTSRPCLLSFCP